jgi:hypothetical protein
MDDTKTYKVSAKRSTGKWWTFGNLKKNQYGNWSIGIKVTDELKELVAANDGKYLNFSLFEEQEKRDVPAEAKAGIAQLNSITDDEIPFG